MKKKQYLFIILCLVSICCLSILFLRDYKKTNTTSPSSLHTATDSLDFAFEVQLKYAKGFSVTNHENYKEIHIFNPTGSDTLASYITALQTTNLPDSLKNKGNFIPVPCQTIACLSTTSVGGLEILDLREHLIGCGSPEYIWDEHLQKRIQKGEILEIGRGMGFNIEQIVNLMPDLLMQNFMNKTDVDGNLSNLGIQIIYNNSWKENTLLGRAEWFKLAALFFSKSRKADSIFNKIEENYQRIIAKAATAKTSPTVVYGMDYRGVWYLPQDNTYVAKMLQEANAKFQGAGAGNSSLPKSFEEIYENYHQADFWLSTASKIHNMKEFLSSNERYIQFKAAKNNKVFLANKREKHSGGNDYWESGHSRPDILLKDVVKILHPELYPEYETVYWHQLK